MGKYKISDKFIRTSKEMDPNIHKAEHIRRWSWIGEDGKTYSQINAPDSEYRKTLEKSNRKYRGNDSIIDQHLTYDIERVNMIEKVQEEYYD